MLNMLLIWKEDGRLRKFVKSLIIVYYINKYKWFFLFRCEEVVCSWLELVLRDNF